MYQLIIEIPTRETPPPRRPPPGPHPRGEIEGDQVQAHTQGEMEGDQIEAHTQGGNSGGSGPNSPSLKTTAAGGTHPTGMHSC